MVKKLYIVILFMILFNIFNVNALDFEAGDFISKDNNHIINISTDGTTIIYDASLIKRK